MKKPRIHFTLWILFGLLIGAAAGRLAGLALLPFVEPPAEIFLRLLRMTVMPLIVTSILSGVLAVGSTAGIVRLGTKTMGYFIGSTLLAILTGQMLVKTFKP
ncbi:MAG: cation:dicarboxylase symporter family transporter, partial [candidate division KSB1 bacterium]|nr:cation:dicarboxylase symporter family transporter [candidate division KSB1 bacterium]